MNPYQTLGISPNATEEEIKNAYKELAKKYHPDKYINNPLADLAAEKMKNINEAYDQIKKERATAGGNGGAYQSTGGNYQGSGEFAQVRNYINMNQLVQAKQMLDNMPNRVAEWYYLYGCVYVKMGNYQAAQQHFQTAVNMDPGNMEYRQAMGRMQNQGQAYRTMGAPGDMACCNLCSTLMCADCCCECMGGDCIPCC